MRVWTSDGEVISFAELSGVNVFYPYYLRINKPASKDVGF